MDKRLLRLDSRKVIKILEKEGFKLSRKKGSHFQYVGYVKGQKMRVTVIVNQKRFAPKTLKSMIEQSGLSERKWLELMDE